MAEPTAAPTPGSMTAPSPANMAGPSPSASASASAVPSMSVTDAQAEEWRRRVRAMALQMPEDKFENMKRHMQAMQAAGHTKETSAELARLTFMADYRIADMRKQALEAANTGPVSGNAAPLDPAPGTTLSLGSAAQLRAQKVAFQHLANNMPVPPAILRAANGELATRVGQNSMDMQDLTVDRVVDAVVSDKLEEQAQAGGIEELDGPSASGSASGSQDQTPTGPPYALELDTSSLIYPYNAFNHPAAYGRDYEGEISMPLNKMQRMLVPSTMPQGLDPYILMQERNRYVENRMAWRMKELEEMSSTAGAESGAKEVPGLANGVQETPANIRARIELMSLRLVGKQRLLREDMVRKMHVASAVPADRSQFRRFRTHTIRDARATETAERRQRTEREQRGKQRHLEYIKSICDHGEAVKEAGRGTLRGGEAIKMGRLGRAMLKMHVDIEKEEQRRLEKLAKDRLKALKADDEDAYMALLGEAKDSRIGHLLKQTDSYLETLANNIREQQNDDVHRDGMAQWEAFETEDGPANEAMFGAKRQDGEDDGIEQREGKVDYYAVAHHIQEKITGQASILTGGTLKDYQVKGLQWMISLYNNRLNGILADEMGLGKTIQTISLITYLIEKKHSPGPFLVIVPLSTLTNWQMEFERWAPSVVTAILKGSPAQRKEVYGRIKAGDFQVCLTTYEYIIKERPMLSKIKWIHMIIDEGHRMKNVQSKLSQTLNTYYSTRYRLILTGTPLQNNLPELWALLNFVLPKIFNSIKSFDEWFSAPFANTGGEKLEMTEEESLLVIKRLHKVLRPFLLRRLKKDVESELPDKVEKVLYTKMSGLQWVMYENVKKYKRLPTETGNTQKKSNKTALQNTYMQLRKIANHPYVFPEVEEDFMTSDQVDENLIRTSGKFELLDRILPKLIATNHKVLIFFQMTEVMTIAYDFFKYRGWETCRLDGSTKADDRQELLRTFNNPESAYKIFILSTRAGGLGLNLQSADTVIIFDSDWNPHADLQAQDRAHRIGQKMEVRVLRLITSKTIEEIILERAQKKLALDGKVIQAGKFDAKTTNEEYEELLAKHFADKDDGDNEEVNELDDDELNEMIARGNEELELFNRMDAEKLALRKEQHARSGDPGPLKPTLMDHSELPAFYRRDLGAEMAEQLVNDEEAGRGRRARNEVNYGADLITDDAWLRANYGLEGGDESAPGAVAGAGLGVEADVDEPTPEPEDPAEMKRRKAQEKKKRKEMNEQLAKAEADGMPLTATSIKIKPFGQAAGAGAGAPDGEEGTPVGKKNKRPRISVTPSVAGDEVPVKKRKTAAAKGTGDDKTFMKRIFDDVYDMTDDIGQPLNQYFVKPVDKKQYPDYFVLIKQPICLSQIKRKFNNASYTLAMFRADMMLLFNNARTFNEEGSWVYGAAEKMQAEFLRLWEEEMGQPGAANPALAKIEDESSPGASGSSTPMFKHHAAAIPPRIKINMGASKRSKEVVASEESASEEDDDDEDYR